MIVIYLHIYLLLQAKGLRDLQVDQGTVPFTTLSHMVMTNAFVDYCFIGFEFTLKGRQL